MNTIGFPISHKENENRRVLIPEDIRKIHHPEMLYFERGYGEILGFSDLDFVSEGVKVCSREEVLQKKIICDPKVGDADYLGTLQNQIIFGWIHAVQNQDITNKIIAGSLTAYAWEEMFEEGRHVFWKNNELAGEAAVMHAFQCYGCMPYATEVAIIGRGNTARGAIRVLNMLGAKVTQYGRKMEKLLQNEIGLYDVIINCVLWDIRRKDHILYYEDLKRMKKNAMIIDVSCDRNGAIESSIPTTFDNPTYEIDGVLHYAVDHTPSLFYKTFSYNNSKIITPYINMLIEDSPDHVLNGALIISEGKIVDSKIFKYQNRVSNILK